MMDKELLKALGVSTARLMKDYVKSVIGPLTGEIEDIKKRLDGIRIPEAIKGEKGDSIKGDKGDSGESAYESAIKNGFKGTERDWLDTLKGEKGDRGESIKGDPGEKGESIKGDPGESIKGDPGPMGLSAYQLAQNEGFRGTRAEWLESLKGRDGQDGKHAESIHPDTIALMVTKEVQSALAALPKPKDGDPGEPGRDALAIDILPEIDSTKSYARGTYAQHDGGLLKAKRRTTVGEAINLNEWEVIIRGISRIEFKQDDTDPRRFVIRSVMTGEIAEEAKFRIPVIVHKGAFVRETIYEKGDVVRWDRSSYVCQADQTSEVPMPLSKDWAILAQRGDRGNDGKNVELPKPHTPVRLGGNGSKE